VNVLLDRRSLAPLRPPPTSIADGRPATHVMQVCCLRPYGPSRVVVSLRVDETTARRFARTCRRETMWLRRVVPWIFALAALNLAPAAVGVANHDLSILLLSNLALLSLAMVTLIGRVALNLQRSRHHPILTWRGDVLVRSVEPATAQAWINLNPPGAVEILR
jgi:hypothetical protein